MPTQPERYDVIVIGAGIVGTMVARFLSRYALRVLLIERAADVGMGATAANTTIVHAGYDAVPGSLKAAMNVQGNRMWADVAGELNVPLAWPGDYVVAVGENERPHLDVLRQRGQANGVTGLEIIGSDEMRRREPLINPQVSAALWAPTCGIIDPFAAAVAAAENAVSNGVGLLTQTAFQDFLWDEGRLVGIQTNRGPFLGRWLINCAGLYADQVMHRAGVHPEFVISPRQGEYYILDRADFTLNNVLFPVPGDKGKGIMVTTTVHGNTIVGPNAQPTSERQDVPTTAEGLQEVWAGALKLVPGLERRHVIATFAGLRATGNAPCRTPGVEYQHDYLIEADEQVKGLLNVAGIESPGLAAAPAIAARVIDLLREQGETLVEKRGWNPIRPARPRFRHLNHAERAGLIAQDARYGRVICRCEEVTEGEILAEMRSPVPPATYDSLKRRTWLGTGRCQGGFDMPLVVEIVARELGLSPLEVTKKGPGSELLSRPTKKAADEGAHEDTL